MAVSLNANALTTLEAAKDYLDILPGDTDQDDRVKRMINAASQRIEKITNRKLKLQTVTEYQDGRANSKLVLRQWPAQKPSVVNLDPSWVYDSENDLPTTDYDVEQDQFLVRKSGYFPKGVRNVKIIYQAGYTEVPSDLEEACLMMVQWLDAMRTDRRVGTKSKSKAGENISFTDDVPPMIMSFIEPYIRIEFPESEQSIRNT